MKRKGNLEEAYQNYKEGMIHRLNADQQGVSENTVKSWCARYDWKQRVEDEKSVHLFMRRLQRRVATFVQRK